ncbi:hypothetical protein WN944_005919 [Citrus x changshan-huyou]|uniref:Reverse transcriptase Ty1/copia-type domain-containing protein n=1 Tax=Citrus x changshan-huyou TaxID=2935761 RepID=A0AAP0MI78_9ROSI
MASVSMSLIEDLKHKRKGEFDMKDLGPAKKILGMQLHRNRNTGTLFLSQEEYIIRVLDKFGMANSKPVQTPLAPHFKLSDQLCPKAEAEISKMMNVPCASVVGCLIYVMILTRPDLSYAVSVVSRRRSLTGYLYTFNNYTVNSKAQLQSVVALSITEAEYIAAAEAVKEAIWMKGMLKELGVDQRSVKLADWWRNFLGSLEHVYIALREKGSVCVMLVTSSINLYLVPAAFRLDLTKFQSIGVGGSWVSRDEAMVIVALSLDSWVAGGLMGSRRMRLVFVFLCTLLVQSFVNFVCIVYVFVRL